MLYNFTEWVQLKKINEECDDPFIHLPQQQGDFVYFGVHDLARQYKENGTLNKLNIDYLMKKIGQCVNADHVEQTVKVYCEKDPFHFGYHKLEDSKARKDRKSKMDDDIHEVDLPVSSLQNITHMFNKEELGKHKIWLVIDGQAKFQKDLMKEIRKKEISKEKQPMLAITDKEDEDEMALDSE